MLEGFPLVTRFSIPFSDVDMMQHVNNVAYIRWCETLRVEYFAQVMKVPINSEHGIIQANIVFSYEHELRYREKVACGIKVSRVGTKSWDFSYEIWSETHAQRAAYGTTAVVAFDFVNHKSIVIPQEWRDAIASYEAGPQNEFV
jgi:acyl-CoA thioester hydrolase